MVNIEVIGQPRMSFTLRTIARSISTRFPLNYQRINNVSWRTNHSQSVTSEKGLPRCPSCGGPLRTHLPACNFCDSISPVPSSWTHYEVLDVPAKPNPFELDPAFLKKRFRALQSVSHPDTWASKGPVTSFSVSVLTSLIVAIRKRRKLRRICRVELTPPIKLC